jgi:biopolymer transport protein ExbD
MKAGLRARSARALYEQHAGPNMTPMVDVVMVILIFFMASTAFLGPEWFLRSALPTPGPADASASPPTRVRVRLVAQAGETAAVVTVNDEPSLAAMPLEGAEALLAARAGATGGTGAAGLVVLVEPEPAASYDAVVRIHEACARLGVTRVGLVEQAGTK